MNERLEKEIKQFCEENVTGYDPIYTGNSLTYSMLPKCACHFYNLALKCVREETVRLNNINKQIAKENKEEVSEWQRGLAAGYADIICFIDNLIK